MNQIELESNGIETPVVGLVINEFLDNLYSDRETALKVAKDLELEERSFYIASFTEEELLNYMVEAYEVSDEEDLLKTIDAVKPYIDDFQDDEIRMIYGDILEIVDEEACEEFLINQIVK